MTDVLFPQEELDRVKLRSTLSGVESELESAGLQDLYDAQVEVLDPEKRFNIKSKEERRAAKQEAWDKSYELNHMDTGAYFLEQKSTREEFEQAHTKEMTPDEANALSKEFGLDIKFEKNVSEGSARYAIFEQLKKKGLKEELAALREEGYDYSWLENVGMALTGTYSLAEFGLDVATAIFLAAATAGIGEAGYALAKAGKLTGTLGKAFMTAKRLQTIERSIQRSKNVAQIAANSARVGEIAKEAEVIKNMTFLQKVGWDYYRSMRGMTSPLFRGGTWTPLVASSLDFGLSNIPTAVLRSKQAELSGEGTFGETMLREEMIAMTLGFGAPLIGRGLGLLFKDRRDLNKVSRAIQETLESSSVEKSAVGHTAGAKADLEAGKIIQEGTDIIGNKFGTEASPAYRESMKSYFMSNATDVEKEANIAYIKKCLQENKVPNLNEMPNMHVALSSIPGMKVIMEEAVKTGMSNEELLHRLINENMVKVITEGKGVSADGSIARLSFGNEKNMLGRFAAAGLSPKQSADFVLSLYKYAFTKDKSALEDALKVIDNMKALQEGLEEIISNPEDPDSFYKIVDAFKEEGEPKVRDTMKKYQDMQSEIAEKGHASASPEEYWIATDALEKDYNRTKETIDLLQTEEGREKLAKMAEDVAEAIKENEALLDFENFYKENFSSPEDFIARLEGDTDDLFAVAKDGVSYEELQRMRAEDISYAEQRCKAAKTVLATTVDELSDSVLEDFIYTRKEFVNKVEKGQSKEHVQKKDLYTLSEETVRKIEDYRDRPLNDISSKIMDAVKEVEEIKPAFSNTTSPKQLEAVIRGARAEVVDTIMKVIEKEVMQPLKDIAPELTGKVFFSKWEIREGLLAEESFAKDLLASSAITDSKGVEKTLKEAATWTTVDNWLEQKMKPIQQELFNVQTEHYHNMNTMLKNWKMTLDAGTYANEAFHGILSGTVFNIDGSAMSIESIANSKAILLAQNIEKRLRASSRGTSATERALDTSGEDLVSYYKDKKNAPGIVKALHVLSSAYRRDMTGRFVKVEENAGDVLSGAVSSVDSADEAVKAAMHYNSRDVRVAEAILDSFADMQQELDALGIGKNFEFRPYSSPALATLPKVSPEGFIAKVDKAALPQIKDNPVAQEFFKFFLPETDEELLGKEKGVSKLLLHKLRLQADGKSNAKCYLLHCIDFDSLGYPVEKGEATLNQLRDTLINEGSINWEDPITVRKIQRIKDYVEEIYKKDVEGADRTLERYNCENAFYLDDIERKTIQIMPQYQADFFARFGHQSVQKLVQQEADRMMNAYALAQKLGSRPKQAFEDLLDMYVLYRKSGRGSKGSNIGSERAGKAIGQLEKGAERKLLQTELRIACGNTESQAGKGANIITAVRNFLSSGLLAQAGFKSGSDIGYSTMDAVNNGLLSRLDVRYWAPLISDLLQVLTNKDFANQLYMSTAFAKDAIVNSAAFKDAILPVMNTGFNKYASLADKLNVIAQRFNDGVFKFTFIDKVTNFNRTRAAYNTYRALGDKAIKSFEELSPEERVLLGRHGVDNSDWEFYRKFCVKGLDEYTDKRTKITDKVFCPDLVAEVSDEEVKAFMREHNIYSSAKKKDISDVLVRRFRSDLADKAAVMIHRTAEESVTMPNLRTRALLGEGTAHEDFWKTLTQFMSFGVQSTYSHLRRALAQNINVETAIARNIVFDAFGQHPIKTTASLLEFIAYTGTVTALINELLSFIQGKHMQYVLDDGSINPEKVKWLLRQYAEPFGIYNTVIDYASNSIQTGVSYVSVAPSFGTLARMTGSVVTAGDKDASLQEKAISKSAAAARNMAYAVGVDRNPLTAALYNSRVGDYLEELSLGEDRYTAKQRRRERQGYAESWADVLLDR